MSGRAVPPFAVKFADSVVEEFTAACEEIARKGNLTLGGYTSQFEALMADLAGVPHAVCVTSGTTALELSFEALKLDRPDILVPTNTNAATAAAVVRAGHRIRFYDAGLWATADQIDAALADSVAAVVVVHIGGFVSPEMDAIVRLCGARGVRLVEDAAHAHGASHDGRPAGSFGDAAAFSFFPTKVITTAEGGMVTTRDKDIADTVRRLRNQGQLDGDVTLIGGSYRLSEFSAALGVAQLKHHAGWLTAQWAIFDAYTAALDELPFATPAQVPERGRTSGYKFVAFSESAEVRERLRSHLRRHDVRLAGGVYETLLHEDRRFQPHVTPGVSAFDSARDFADRHFCLPAWPALTEVQQNSVIAALRSFDCQA